MREVLLAMRPEYRLEPGDAVVAVRDAGGRVKLNQLFQPVEQGATSSWFWSALIGLLFVVPPARAAPGAPAGALGARLSEFGVSDDFIRAASRTLQSGNAVLFLLARKMTTDKVLAELHRVGGTVLRTSFDETKEEALQAAFASARKASAAAAA